MESRLQHSQNNAARSSSEHPSSQNDEKPNIFNDCSNPQFLLRQSQSREPSLMAPSSIKSVDLKRNIENGEKTVSYPTQIETIIPTNVTTGSIDKKSETSRHNFIKPVTIMSLDDRDIVVIDKADIKELTKNEGNVIVVNKQQNQQNEIDLVDLLGGNWPEHAGDAALVLNKFMPKELKHEHEEAKKTSVYDNVIHPELGFSASKKKESKELSDDLGLTSSTIENQLCGLGVGSMVEVSMLETDEDLYGVIRWIGIPPNCENVMIGVELEDIPDNKHFLTTNGTFNGISLFKCQEGRALLVLPSQCSIDRRFVDFEDSYFKNLNSKKQKDTKMFGQVECPSVPGAVSPLKIYNCEELKDICGKFKGIQGHHNSCYLDATLFSMFTFTHVFDSLLFRPSEPDDISHYDEVQKVLREEIVNPLRKNLFVRADRIMKLRELLDKLSSISGLTTEEKDPEEFINSLLAQIMRVEPFLKLSSGQDAYFYQLFVEKDERLSFPSVQQLFEQSFQSSDIKLKEVPSTLIIQMPRFGKNFKMYSRILPSQILDVTDIIEDSPRQCSVCGKLSEFECSDCFGLLQSGVGLESTSFCGKCLETVHLHIKRANHNFKKVNVPNDFKIMADHMTVPRLFMELFAVVCIETSHYVTFVKAGSGPDAPWCFFDSMADRKGEKNGYNIPEITSVPDLPIWLSEEGARKVNEMSPNDKMLPEHSKRLFCDAYMCMYQSTDVMMYR